MSVPASGSQAVQSQAAPSLAATFVNVFEASGSSEELLIHLGLDPHRPAAGEPAVLTQRLALTWPAAKRLLLMLQDLVRRHESQHGPLPPGTPGRPPGGSPRADA